MSHSELVYDLKKPAEDIRQSLTEKDCDLLHMIIGVSGETGELLDAIKKHIIYRSELDIEHIKKEMGDIEFYLEGLRQALGVGRDEILQINIDKLTERYGDEYSNEAAIARSDMK